MAALPSEDKPTTVDACSHQLQAMKEGAIHKFTGASARETLASTLEVLADIKAGRGPKEKYMTSDAMVKVKAKLPLLCQHIVVQARRGGGGGGEKVIYGQEAAQAKFKVVKETIYDMLLM